MYRLLTIGTGAIRTMCVGNTLAQHVLFPFLPFLVSVVSEGKGCGADEE